MCKGSLPPLGEMQSTSFIAAVTPYSEMIYVIRKHCSQVVARPFYVAMLRNIDIGRKY